MSDRDGLRIPPSYEFQSLLRYPCSLFGRNGSHCFKKILVDLKGKEGAQTNQLIAFFAKEQRCDVESFLFHSGQWILASPLVCFGAKGNSNGWFTTPVSGNLVAVKLVHLFGYVSCHVYDGTFWSFWGCGENNSHGLKALVDTVITDDHNRILMPPTQLVKYHGRLKWYKIPGYNSQSPEIVLSRFSPTSVARGQRLRLWYGEDLANLSEGDNGGKVCCKVYVMYA